MNYLMKESGGMTVSVWKTCEMSTAHSGLLEKLA